MYDFSRGAGLAGKLWWDVEKGYAIMGFRRGLGATIRDLDEVLAGKGAVPFSDWGVGSDFGGSLMST